MRCVQADSIFIQWLLLLTKYYIFLLGKWRIKKNKQNTHVILMKLIILING